MKQRLLRMAATILAFAMCSTAALATSGEARGFVDVPTTHWAYNAIQRAADNGWVQGVGDGRFGPDGTVSNAQWIVMVTRAFYANKVERISNSEQWWSPYCSVAAANGVLEATTLGDSYFTNYKWDESILNAEISRYDMAQVALNYMSGSNFTVSEREKKDAQAKIGDWADIPVEYRDGVSACYALGVISGTSAGTFEGERSMSRAEAATVLVRLADATGKGSTVTPTPTPTPEPTPTPTPAPTPTNFAPADVNQDGILTEDEVYEALMAFKEEVPAETPWGDDKYYESATAGRGYGCAAFVYQASDRAFNLPKREVSNATDLRVGDIIHFKNKSHWVIVTGFGDEYYYGASGNTNGVVSWNGRGEYSSLEELVSEGQAIIYTRGNPENFV